MRPLYVSGCLGWLHAPLDARQNVTLGVVLCPALGREARWTYRSMRQLADRLASAGLPTLRFEYPGTGDSADAPDGINPFEAWQSSIHLAVDWLRAHTGLEQVALVGLRLGALLAADTAVSRADIAAVAMLAPVLSGRAYARELKMAAIGGAGEAQPDDGIELDGMVLPDAALAAMGKIDLMRQFRAPAARMLVMDNNPPASAYVDHCCSQGVDASAQAFPGYKQMMNVATSNRVPQAALDCVTGWLGQISYELAPLRTARWKPIAAEDTVLRQGEYHEIPLQFGPGRLLAGVLCEPACGATNDLAVLITNTGGDPRAGIGGFGTRMARCLAAMGITTLRFDFAGLGDSRLPGDLDGHLYEVDRAGDIGAAIDLLHHRGYRRFGAAGVCTGAYHIMHAALGDPRIDLLLLINLVTFRWRTGDALEVAQRSLGWSTSRYKELMWRPDTWRRLVSGQVDFLHVARTLGRRLPDRLARMAAHALGCIGLHTELNEPRRLAQDLLQRGTRLLLVLGFEDPGVAALESNFGRAGRLLSAMPGADVRIERGIDHTLSRRFMQDHVIGILANAVVPGHSAQAADDLSRRTEQQAATLEEIAAALDQITAMVEESTAASQSLTHDIAELERLTTQFKTGADQPVQTVKVRGAFPAGKLSRASAPTKPLQVVAGNTVRKPVPDQDAWEEF